MSVATIANRYARALADVIIEKRETAEVASELANFAGLVENHQELRDVFASPVVAQDRKRAVLDQLLSLVTLRPTSANFLKLLLSNNRIHQLDAVLKALSKELDARTNVVVAEIVTAREISADEQKLLHQKLQAATGKDVKLQFKMDADIIGGVVARVGSKVYDGSIKNQLAQMKQRLIQAS